MCSDTWWGRRELRIQYLYKNIKKMIQWVQFLHQLEKQNEIKMSTFPAFVEMELDSGFLTRPSVFVSTYFTTRSVKLFMYWWINKNDFHAATHKSTQYLQRSIIFSLSESSTVHRDGLRPRWTHLTAAGSDSRALPSPPPSSPLLPPPHHAQVRYGRVELPATNHLEGREGRRGRLVSGRVKRKRH